MQMIQLRVEKLTSSLGVAYATSNKQARDKGRDTRFASDLRYKLLVNRFDNPAQKEIPQRLSF
jgi:hypothetical protein